MKTSSIPERKRRENCLLYLKKYQYQLCMFSLLVAKHTFPDVLIPSILSCIISISFCGVEWTKVPRKTYEHFFHSNLSATAMLDCSCPWEATRIADLNKNSSYSRTRKYTIDGVLILINDPSWSGPTFVPTRPWVVPLWMVCVALLLGVSRSSYTRVHSGYKCPQGHWTVAISFKILFPAFTKAILVSIVAAYP